MYLHMLLLEALISIRDMRYSQCRRFDDCGSMYDNDSLADNNIANSIFQLNVESSDSASGAGERNITNSKSKSFAFDMCLLRHDPAILILSLKAQIKLHESLSPSRHHTLCIKDESCLLTIHSVFNPLSGKNYPFSTDI
ncbi:hypothetical protein CDAR_547831 [Caerostris darwini]|uniref:Uncharacterized protein n=1 Tax=Caerostris darwini TaxID=1538125 RepID=A0AAV4WER7_9ARAC|nr:hypothetical protein CDAR_547831 [Caerostris darwini]